MLFFCRVTFDSPVPSLDSFCFGFLVEIRGSEQKSVFRISLMRTGESKYHLEKKEYVIPSDSL